MGSAWVPGGFASGLGVMCPQQSTTGSVVTNDRFRGAWPLWCLSLVPFTLTAFFIALGLLRLPSFSGYVVIITVIVLSACREVDSCEATPRRSAGSAPSVPRSAWPWRPHPTGTATGCSTGARSGGVPTFGTARFAGSLPSLGVAG